MIKQALQLRHRIDAFCAVNQRSSRWPRDDASADDDGGSVRRTLTPADWDTLKELFELTKPFRDFTARMEGRAKVGSYRALWKVLPAIHKLVEEYERHSTHYTALALSNQYTEGEDGDMEVNYILISINNALGKLHKYQELLPQSPAYAAVIAMNPTLHWRWMKKKAPHLLGSSKADVLRLWERDYNSKVTA